MADSSSRFRDRRALIVNKQIAGIAAEVGRPIVILDVGGRPATWKTLPPGVEKIILVNIDDFQLSHGETKPYLETRIGDACDLVGFQDQSVDFVFSNSVIEHVGGWSAMKRMATELRRVGRHGWVQTPAFEFPIEPHWRLPFVHWMGRSAQAGALGLRKRFRGASRDKRREIVEGVNLVSRTEMKELFPDGSLHVERFALLPKSYCVAW